MFGKKPGLNPLQLQKQLLVAASELNRVQMDGDLAVMMAGVHQLTNRARSFSLIAAAAAAAVAAVAAFRKPTVSGAKTSWLQTLLKGAGLISNLWLAFRGPGRDRVDQENNT